MGLQDGQVEGQLGGFRVSRVSGFLGFGVVKEVVCGAACGAVGGAVSPCRSRAACQGPSTWQSNGTEVKQRGFAPGGAGGAAWD